MDFARFIRCPWLNLELHRDFFLGTAVCERNGARRRAGQRWLPPLGQAIAERQRATRAVKTTDTRHGTHARDGCMCTHVVLGPGVALSPARHRRGCRRSSGAREERRTTPSPAQRLDRGRSARTGCSSLRLSWQRVCDQPRERRVCLGRLARAGAAAAVTCAGGVAPTRARQRWRGVRSAATERRAGTRRTTRRLCAEHLQWCGHGQARRLASANKVSSARGELKGGPLQKAFCRVPLCAGSILQKLANHDVSRCVSYATDADADADA